MANTTVKHFYKTKVTENGFRNIPAVTASIVPDTGKSECDELSDSSDDIDLQSNDISSVDNSQLGVKASSDVARGRGVIVSDDNGSNTSEIVAVDDVPSVSSVSYPSAANYRWRKRTPLPVQSQFSGNDFPDPTGEELTPRQYFDQFFTPDLFDKIANETNLYSVQTSGKSVNTNAMEIEQYIGIITQMDILNYPQYRMYWDPTSRIPLIANVMGLTRFENDTSM